MVDSLLRTRVPRWEELNRAIDERDDMLDYALRTFEFDRDRALTSYFQNALEQFALVRHIARWRGSARPRRMLDFASGYGRLTRLLVHEQLADEITVSDILEGGMEFQAAQFGVRTILSKKTPEEFVADGTYDLIFVASLFTHLPPATFTRWLRRLAELLAPEGLLIFSVHDESLAPKKVDGILFASNSESRVLDVEDYGSTWVTETYVREQVASIGANFDCIRLPRALTDWQDVYVISPAPVPSAPPRRTPKGYIDNFSIGEEGVRISGWATLIDEQADRVEVRLDDELLATIRDFTPRPDAATWLGVPSIPDAAWVVVIPHASIRSYRYQLLSVAAFTKENEEAVFFIGTIDSLNGWLGHRKADFLGEQLAARDRELAAAGHNLAVAEMQRQTLERQIAAMKQSRFWRARDRWFRLKRAIGLTDEL
jgi:SAM-dependent methyltransferase